MATTEVESTTVTYDNPVEENEAVKGDNGANEENVNGEEKEELQVEPAIKDEPKENSVVKEIKTVLEHPDIKNLKEVQRRRSLRAEQNNIIKKKPPKYDEILNCYKRKEYKECVIYIDLVAENAKDCIEYQILKATCLAHIGGSKLAEAHRILDECLKQRPDNLYCVYAKGLAYFQDCRWKESIEYFTKAIKIDKASMQRAEILLKLAEENLENEKAEDDNEEQDQDTEMDVDEESTNASTANTMEAYQDSDDSLNKRFGCEICVKYFCKKFNLDRHNRTFHNRDTPPIPPLPRNRQSLPMEPIKIKKEKIEDESIIQTIKEEKIKVEYDDDEDYTPTTSAVKKRSVIRIKPRNSSSGKSPDAKKTILKNGMARCNICKKIYTKGSLARHQIIHTGVKSFKCEECGKAFYQKSDLERHVVSTIYFLWIISFY